MGHTPEECRPTQPDAIDKDYSTQDELVIDTRLAMALQEERLQPLQRLVGQPEMIAHQTPASLEA